MKQLFNAIHVKTFGAQYMQYYYSQSDVRYCATKCATTYDLQKVQTLQQTDDCVYI